MPSGGHNKKPSPSRARGKVGPGVDLAPPATIGKDMRAKWSAIVADLVESGTVTRSDLVLLERAFGQLGNADRLQRKFEEALSDPDCTPTNLAKYQNAVTSATTSFLRLVLEVRRAVKLFSKAPEEDDALERTIQ